MIRPPPRSPLFPYTTLFRSSRLDVVNQIRHFLDFLRGSLGQPVQCDFLIAWRSITMTTRITRNAIPSIFVLLFVSVVCQAQSNFATLNGTVLDPQDKAVPGSSIQLIAVSTNAVRQVTSNEDGVFQITGLLPGPYKLDVTASGFAAFTETVRLEVGQQMNLDLHLKLS